VSVSLERFGDRWSLLIIRDLMVRGYTTFKQFKESGEGIATNVLTARLRRLETEGLIESERDEGDARRVHYRLTEKGIGLAPVILELLLWSARYEETAAPCEVMEEISANREDVLAEVKRRWKERDPEPFLRPFVEKTKPRKAGKTRSRCG
jgi:DNA-binding HxlR family transcriptional regulator